MQKNRFPSRSRSAYVWYVVALGAVGGIVLATAHASENPADSKSPSVSCIQCHAFEPSQSHPVNTIPFMTTPTSLPLENGKLACLTCHDASPTHSDASVPVGIRGGDASGLCVQCHAAESQSAPGIHALSIGKAHQASYNIRSTTVVSAGLDSESAGCMSCHDGSIASKTVSHNLQLPFADQGADHPVGVPMKATDRTRGGDFKIANPATLDRRIRLSGGNISCASCHSMYSKEPKKLVMSNQGSKLCLSCHTQ